MPNGRRLTDLGVLCALCALVVLLAPTRTHAQEDRRHTLRIDGSTESAFEASIASIQDQLPARKREDFDLALAAVWFHNSLHSADIDHDGDVDADDSRLLADGVVRLFADIQRGDLLSAIEKREANGDEYTVADYVEQLDGLGYDEVLKLARPAGGNDHGAALGQYFGTELCGGVRLKRCEGRDGPPIIGRQTAAALDAALDSMHAQKLAEARATIGKLNVNRLSAYERGRVELALVWISYAEGKYTEARDHARNAIDTGALTEPEFFAALDWVRVLDDRLAASPR